MGKTLDGSVKGWLSLHFGMRLMSVKLTESKVRSRGSRR